MDLSDDEGGGDGEMDTAVETAQKAKRAKRCGEGFRVNSRWRMSGKSAGTFDVYLFSRGPVVGDDKGGGGTPGGDHSKSPMQVSKSERAKRCRNWGGGGGDGEMTYKNL